MVASRSESPAASGSVVEMIRNWNNKKNKIFDFSMCSQDASRFKATKRRQWIENLPNFNNLLHDNNCSNLTNSLFVCSPMGLVFYVAVQAINSSEVNNALL